MAYARRVASRPHPLSAMRHLDPGALVAVGLAVAAITAGLGHLQPIWSGAVAAAGLLLATNARQRALRRRRPTVDEVRSLVLSMVAILLALGGLALVAPSLLVYVQTRLGQ